VAKGALVLFNVLTAGPWYRETRQRNLLAVFHLLSLSWLRSSGKKARSYLHGWTLNITAYLAPYTEESLRLEQKAKGMRDTEEDAEAVKQFFSSVLCKCR
jgi:hypothetical protein